MKARVVLVAGFALIAVACSSAINPNGGGEESGVPFPVEQIGGTSRESVPSALADPTAPGLPRPTVDPREIRSGGPPPDGIPPIDEPKFVVTHDAAYLRDTEPVLALEISGDSRAYPVQILIWHEIVNDTVGKVPVSVTYCPLCNSAVAVDRRAGGRLLTFGTSGSLYKSALVMYDRQTESLWSHFSAEAVAGVLTGTRLDEYPVSLVSWRDWRDANPGGLVLSRETGFDRSYGRNPYPGYDDISQPPFLFEGETDGRLAPKERVVGLGLEAEPRAVLLSALLERGVVRIDLGGRQVTVMAIEGTASALEGTLISDGRDVGATGAFITTYEGRNLTMTRHRRRFVDAETGSTWSIFGLATAGPLTGVQLKQVPHVDTFWFAWAAFAPQTTVLP